jgi:hypothetical protein
MIGEVVRMQKEMVVASFKTGCCPLILLVRLRKAAVNLDEVNPHWI